MKRVLKLVGNFQELGYDDDPRAPRLADARGHRSHDHKSEVVRYLNSGKMFVFSPGVDEDIFENGKLADTCSIVTDGTFMWQKQIAYYVEHYDIELPSEFEAHMRANGWRVPDEIDIGTLKGPH
jgi:hypothetical protein